MREMMNEKMSVVTFNNRGLPSFVKVTDISFDAIGDLSIQEAVIAGRVGNFDQGINRGGKSIQLTLKLIKGNGSIHDYSDELKHWLKGDDWKPSKLVFAEQPDFYTLARVNNSVNINDLFAVGETSIDFYAADPIKYKNSQTIIQSTDDMATFHYEGLEETAFLVKFKAVENMNRVTFKHKKTGRMLSIRGNIVRGDEVEVDSNKKIMRVNGAVNMNLASLDNQWLYSVDGLNEIEINTGTYTQSFEVHYTERR